MLFRSGWRKSIHESAAAQLRPATNGNIVPRDQGPITISSQSPTPGGINHDLRYQAFRCKWQNCKAELHNLETLKKHVHKVHHKESPQGTLECLWGTCRREATNADAATDTTVRQHLPHSFQDEVKWREHLEIRHFGPLSWELGDGPASGLSGKSQSIMNARDPTDRPIDAHENEAYLSDAMGRRVTPRISVDSPASQNRGRPPTVVTQKEKQAQDMLSDLVAHKRRLGDRKSVV